MCSQNFMCAPVLLVCAPKLTCALICTLIWVEPGRKGKGQKIGNFTLYVLGSLDHLLEIAICLKHIEASHIMAFNS